MKKKKETEEKTLRKKTRKKNSKTKMAALNSDAFYTRASSFPSPHSSRENLRCPLEQGITASRSASPLSPYAPLASKHLCNVAPRAVVPADMPVAEQETPWIYPRGEGAAVPGTGAAQPWASHHMCNEKPSFNAAAIRRLQQ